MKFGTYMGLATKLIGSGILNFGPCAAHGHPSHPNLAGFGVMTRPDRGPYCSV